MRPEWGRMGLAATVGSCEEGEEIVETQGRCRQWRAGACSVTALLLCEGAFTHCTRLPCVGDPCGPFREKFTDP